MSTQQEHLIKAVTDAWVAMSPGKRYSVGSGLHGPALYEALEALTENYVERTYPSWTPKPTAAPQHRAQPHECDMPTTGFDPDWPTWVCTVCGKAYQWEYYENDHRFVAWVRRADRDEVKR